MSEEMIQMVKKIRGGFQLGGHVNVTQLSRSTSWRRELSEYKAMEILDRNQTAAVLLTPEAYLALTEYIDTMEHELESAQIEKLITERKDMNDWKSGEELAKKAKKSFQSRQEILRGVLDDDQ